jgi:hypothetical protein
MFLIHLILLVLALVCFLGAAVGVSHPRINLQALGLFFWVGAELFAIATK